ncbi:geranylgeranyl reductase family protein [Cuniculiplasma sp. SKW3]|uniref:geranylgeranyl reductase family protein n=1 Tax=Cuniculiplasma sp. SKW3 TaxID=3400170 RepID=UPI003FD35DB8
MYDFIINGAGPAGSFAAYNLSLKGFKVMQLEEHEAVGKPVECTGLVSRRVIEMSRTKSVINRVHGAHIVFPDDNSIHIRKDEESYVLERDRFDQDLSGLATGAGTELKLKSRMIDVNVNNDKVRIKFREGGNLREEDAMAIIGADGANSITRKILFPGMRIERMISAYQIDGAKMMDDQDSVNVYLGSSFSRGFFGWATPAGDLARIGTAGFGLSREKFININSRMGNPSKITITGGPIPISTLKKTYGNRVLLVGDAGGIVKPLSGGGIYTGMISGQKAAEALTGAYDHSDFSQSFLKVYEVMWKREIGKELKRDLRIQKMFAKISDRSFVELGRRLGNPKITEIINNLGDIDYPSRVVLNVLMRSPGILRHVLIPMRDKVGE